MTNNKNDSIQKVIYLKYIPTIVCEPAAPSAAPQSVTAVSINSTEIRVTWLAPPPSTQNGQLSGYQVPTTDETCSTVQSDTLRRV